MRVLVSGVTGLLGGSLCREWQGQDEPKVISVGRKEPSEEIRLGLAQSVLFQDMEELPQMLREVEFDCLVHCAAMSGGGACEQDPQQAEISNVRFTELLAQISRERAAPLCHISTDLVFDGGTAPAGGFSEEAPPQPLSVYARTKRKAEEVVLAEAADGSFVLRTSLLYGPPVGEKRGFLGWFHEGFLGGEGLTLFEDEWRTPVYLPDVARVIWELLAKAVSAPRRLSHNLYHCAGPERLSRVQMGELYANQIGSNSRLISRASRLSVASVPPRPEDVSLNIKRLVSELGWTPRSFSQGLSSMVLQGGAVGP